MTWTAAGNLTGPQGTPGVLDASASVVPLAGTLAIPAKANTWARVRINDTDLFLPAFLVVAITTTSIPIPDTDTGTIQMQATGGQTPYTWSVDAGTPLPAGVTMDSTGLISYDGTQVDSTTPVTFTVEDSAGIQTSKQVTVSVVVGTHKAWRVYVTANNGGSVVETAEIQMRATAGGATQCTGGTAFASSAAANDGNGPYTADKAFDGALAPPWASASGPPQYVGYLFPSPVPVDEFTIAARSDSMANPIPSFFPKDFTFQSSDDTTTGADGTWHDEWNVTGQTGWTVLSQVRVFTRP